MRPTLASASIPTRCSSTPNDPDAGFSAETAVIAEALFAASSVNARSAVSRRLRRNMAGSLRRVFAAGKVAGEAGSTRVGRTAVWAV
jgi:hypothetical protein